MATVKFGSLLSKTGIVTSETALRLLEFLEASGGAPPEACELLLRRARDRFRTLRGAGYALQSFFNGEELWLPREHNVRTPEDFARQRALGRFVARLIEAGGSFSGRRARFPNGKEMPAIVLPFDKFPGSEPFVAVLVQGTAVKGLPVGCFWCWEKDLRKQKLRECLRLVR